MAMSMSGMHGLIQTTGLNYRLCSDVWPYDRQPCVV